MRYRRLPLNGRVLERTATRFVWRSRSSAPDHFPTSQYSLKRFGDSYNVLSGQTPITVSGTPLRLVDSTGLRPQL